MARILAAFRRKARAHLAGGKCGHHAPPASAGLLELADELEVPLLAKVPLSAELREHADTGSPLVLDEPDAPGSQAIRAAARGIVAATPQELPVMQAESPAAPALR